MEPKTEEYWTGPYDVLVSNNIKSVVADDGYNTHYSNGSVTEMFMMNAPPMNAEIYKSKFCEFKDGKYYYSDK